MTSKQISVLLAAAAFLVSASRIDNGLVNSGLPSGPGLTLDESFNIGQGVYLFESFLDHGPLLFVPSTAQEVFGADGYLPDHPPLARFVLGAAHQTTAWAFSGTESALLNVPAARLGSCFAFALTVLVLSEFAGRRYGGATAALAGLCMLLMPRVIGHSRIAALETVTTLMWLAALVPLLTWWTGKDVPTTKQCVVGGIFWGLLMLTKVQGVLLPPLVVVWALWQYRRKAIRPLAVWGIVGGVVFFLGWPWLWLDPVNHTLQYLGRTADRPTLYVWYLGQRFADKTVPWHFPLVMTVTTVPVFVLVAFAIRLVRGKPDGSEKLLLASICWPPLVFALPGTPVYDATRLYLVIMPAIALIAARGLVLTAGLSALEDSDSDSTADRRRPDVLGKLTVGVLAVLAVTKVPTIFSPFALSDYNLVTGGVAGAQSAGLEVSYWSDGLNSDFWNQVPEDSTVFVAPVCHQFQLTDIEQLVPAVQRRRITLKPFLYDPEAQRGLMLMIHRLADLPPLLRSVPEGADVMAEAGYQGVVLARLIDTTDATWPERPVWPEP